MLAGSGTSSMLHLFLGLKSLVKVRRYHTDGSVFRLHYKITTMVLLAFTFIVTTRQYVGAPIMCVHTREIPKEVLNTYCWIHPTYTLSSAHWKRVGIDVPHPGVDKTRDAKDKKHVKYYQWVGFLLFLQVGLSFVHHRHNTIYNPKVCQQQQTNISYITEDFGSSLSFMFPTLLLHISSLPFSLLFCLAIIIENPNDYILAVTIVSGRLPI